MKPLRVKLEIGGIAPWFWDLIPVSPSAPIHRIQGKGVYERRCNARRAALLFAERHGFEVVEGKTDS